MTDDAALARVCGPEALDRVVEILVGAFYEDPTWCWAFPDPALRGEQHRRVWRMLVEGAARYPSVWLNAGETATAVWVPPGGTEMSEEQAAQVEPTLVELLGAEDAPRVLALFQALEEVHPHHTEHYFLTLLGVDPAHRGKGLGLQLLEDTLQLVDDDHAAAYLEASNPVNIPLYERYGFLPYGTVTLPHGLAVTTMWRERR